MREVDFNIEREAAARFASNFEGFDEVKIPETHADYSTSKVLTMEYVPGVKISDKEALAANGFDDVHISNTLTTSYLEQARSRYSTSRYT